MGKDLAEAADSYMDFPGGDARLPLMSRAAKDLESEQFDYDSLSDGNPNPSLRDQEYLQHRLEKQNLFHIIVPHFKFPYPTQP